MNVQFFADGGDGSSSTTDGGNGTSGGTGDQSQSNTSGDNKAEEKAFTQTELNTIAANEKRQGKQSMLKELGFKDETDAKAQMEEYAKWKASQKTPEQLAQEKAQQSADTASEAEKRAAAAENKLALMLAGVNKDSLDDALAIASLKVTESKNLDAVLKEMQGQDRYKGFFATTQESGTQGSKGTGSSVGNAKGSAAAGTESLGKKLAKDRLKAMGVKYNEN